MELYARGEEESWRAGQGRSVFGFGWPGQSLRCPGFQCFGGRTGASKASAPATQTYELNIPADREKNLSLACPFGAGYTSTFDSPPTIPGFTVSAPEVCCPKCSTRLLLPPDNTATRFRCTKCATVFDLTAPVLPPPPPPEPEPEAPAPVPVPAPSPVFEFPDTQPDADETAPAPRSRSRRTEVDEPPRSRRPAKSGSGGKIILIAGIGSLLLVGAAVGGYFAFRDPPKPVVKADPTPTPAPKPSQQKTSPILTPEQAIKKVKASTVYIRTTRRDGVASGTGFFAGKPGFVVTNAHVVGYVTGYGEDELKVPVKLEVVVDSGEGGERTFAASIYGLDAEKDLALLKITDGASLPPMLTLGKSEELTETQEVIVFGYPFGESLGKNVSVNRTTVSSLRKTNGTLERVQLAGGINPGNSGGPVANVKGEVIGVSVSSLRKTETIVFAIPAETTNRFLEDQFARPTGQIILGSLAELSPDELEGPYLLVGKESKGEKLTEDDLKKLGNRERAVLIKSGQFVTVSKGKAVLSSFSVDKTQKPAHIDIVSTTGDTTEMSYGIYKLEKGVLTICLTKGEEKDRPTEFKADNAATIMILKKQIPK